MHPLRPHSPAWLLAALVAAGATLPAAAGEDALPGVDASAAEPAFRRPAPEPEDEREPGTFRAGNWDVRISGSVSVEIGAASGPMPTGGTTRR